MFHHIGIPSSVPKPRPSDEGIVELLMGLLPGDLLWIVELRWAPRQQHVVVANGIGLLADGSAVWEGTCWRAEPRAGTTTSFSARPLGSLENGVANLIRSHLAHDFSSLVAWLLYFFHPLAPTWNFSGSTERCWFGSVLWERSLETPPWKRAVFWNGSFRPWKKRREKTTGQLKKNQHPGDYFIKKFRRWLFSQLCWKSKY